MKWLQDMAKKIKGKDYQRNEKGARSSQTEYKAPLAKKKKNEKTGPQGKVPWKK